jgi:hypothetical protein
MAQATLRNAVTRIGPLQVAIIVLAVATALVHLDKSLTTSLLAPPHPMRAGHGHPAASPFMMLVISALPVLFFLNFVGYLVLVTALYLPALRRYQRATRFVLAGYAVVTILAWFLITRGAPNLLAYVDKPLEVLLVLLLLIEDRQARSMRLID